MSTTTPITDLTEGGAAAPLCHNGTTLSLAGPRDFYDLLKPRVMSLVVFTALVGMVAAPGAVASWPLALMSLFAIAVGAGASGALNMVVDADIDAVMGRTKQRPIPSGRVSSDAALAFGGTLALLSVWTLALTANLTAAALLSFTIFFYAVIYSIGLKRRTPQNIVIGGAAGALPPVVGWAAITGTAPFEPWILFLLIFLWTPPHFWALALMKRGDYDAAGIPMMPNVKGEPHTRKLIWQYSIVLTVSAIAPVVTPMAGWLYGAVAALSSARFLQLAWRVKQTGEKEACAKLFAFSIFYLFALFFVLLLEHWIGFHG